MSADFTEILRDVETLLEEGEEIKESEPFLSGEKRKQVPRMYIIVRTTKRDLFVKTATDPADREGLRKEYGALSRLQSKVFQTPRPLGLFDWGIVIPRLNGISLDKRIGKEPISSELRSLLEQVVFRISSFHSSARKNTPSATSLEKIYRELTGKDISSEDANILALASFGFTHGDLDPFNLLVTGAANNEFALIDWEDFREDGVQELDIIHFVIMLAVVTNPDISHGELYEVIFKPKSLSMDLLQIYCDERQISLPVVQQFIPMYCDAQNFRLIKANRSVQGFLYNTFKERFYDS